MSNEKPDQLDVWLIFYHSRLLILPNTKNLPLKEDANQFRERFIREHHLGDIGNYCIHCAELHDEHLEGDYAFVPMRQALDLLGTDWYTVATKAFSIINWDRNHQYCGRCGDVTEHKAGAYERVCTNCKLQFFPRISPSIIVLIYRGDEILMARSYHFPPNVYGLIAGFVEAGESVEEAIHRETLEETGIRIKNLRYYQSQAWPFPDSLMLGFFAEYDSGELNIDNDEIEAAGWYRYDKLPGRPSTNISIASKLIEAFIQQKDSEK